MDNQNNNNNNNKDKNVFSDDNIKDTIILNKLQKDKIISKKADDVFNKFLAETDFSKIPTQNNNFIDCSKKQDTEEVNKVEVIEFNKVKEEPKEERKYGNYENNKKEKVVDLNEKRENTHKSFKERFMRLTTVAACLLLLVGGANVYATSMGYDNIFFMIKYIVTDNEDNAPKKREELLEDKEITISNEPIRLNENVQFKIKKIQVKDNIAKIIILTKQETREENKIIYKVVDENGKVLTSQESKLKSLGKLDDYVVDEIEVKDYKESDSVIYLQAFENDTKIAALDIDLNNKEVIVQGSKEAIEKISEIELNKFLSYVPIYMTTEENNENSDYWRMYLVNECYKELISSNNSNLIKYMENDDKSVYVEVELFDKVANSLGISLFDFNNNSYGRVTTKEYIDGKECYKYTDLDGFDISFNNPYDAKYNVLNITNIEYLNGLYTVTFNYMFSNKYSEFIEESLRNNDIYQATIGFNYNNHVSENECKFKFVKVFDNFLLKSRDTKVDGMYDNSVYTNSNIYANTTNNNYNNATNTVNNNSAVSQNRVSNYTNNIAYNYSNSYYNNAINQTHYNYVNNVNNTNKGDYLGEYDYNDNINNYAVTMSWTEAYYNNMKFKYPSIFTAYDKNVNGLQYMEISGEAVGRNPDNKKIIRSNLKIMIKEPLKATKEEIASFEQDFVGIDTGKIRWKLSRIEDAGKIKDSYISFDNNNNRREVVFEYDYTDDFNYKVLNIINWFLGSCEYEY